MLFFQNINNSSISCAMKRLRKRRDQRLALLHRRRRSKMKKRFEVRRQVCSQPEWLIRTICARYSPRGNYGSFDSPEQPRRFNEKDSSNVSDSTASSIKQVELQVSPDEHRFMTPGLHRIIRHHRPHNSPNPGQLMPFGPSPQSERSGWIWVTIVTLVTFVFWSAIIFFTFCK